MSKRKKKKDIPRPKEAVLSREAPSDEKISLKLNIGIFAVFLIIALAIFANTLSSPFIWDDSYLIHENHFIKDVRYIPDSFTNHLYYSSAGLSNFYRPLQTLLILVDYHIWKDNQVGYHLTNILFHVLSAWAIYALIALLIKKKGAAFMVALLFLVHPANSTVVDYISSRADSQVTFFAILSIYLYFLSRRARLSRALFIGSLFAFFLALISKELAVIVPFLLVLTGLIFRRGDDRGTAAAFFKRMAPYFALLAAYVLLRVTVLNFPNASNITPPPLYTRLCTTSESFVRLMLLLIYPSEIHIEKNLPFSSGIFQPSTFISIAALIFIAVTALYVRKRSKTAFFGFAWFFTALIPMANIMPINATIADHWLYLPCMGFFLVFIGGLRDAVDSFGAERRAGIMRLLTGIFVCAVLLFSIRTVYQNTIWADPIKFYKLALKHSPKSFRAHNELGVIYLDDKKLDEAILEFKQAIELNTRFDQAFDNLGVAYDLKGEYERATEAHLHALKLNPQNVKIYNNLGNVYNKSGQYDKAIEAYTNALRLNPAYKAVYSNIGVIYYKKGDYDKAKQYWEKALQIDPHFKMASDNIAVLERFLRDKAAGKIK
ncbi:MAG: tetratricopeptide repeat protein [Candidatus Omnitrophota bacterium]